MTLDEKAGMLLIDQLNADAGGQVPELAGKLLFEEKMTRFILRNTVTNSPKETGHPFFGRAGHTVRDGAVHERGAGDVRNHASRHPRALQIQPSQPLRGRRHGRIRRLRRCVLCVAQRSRSGRDARHVWPRRETWISSPSSHGLSPANGWRSASGECTATASISRPNPDGSASPRPSLKTPIS